MAPFGEWESPITASFITKAGVSLSSVTVGPVSGNLYWLEGRPKEGGRNVLCCHVGKDHPGASERGAVEVTPAEANVRTRVHEYGGAAFVVGADPDGGGECCIYSDFKSQRLYKVALPASAAAAAAAAPSAAVCLTPEGPAWPADAPPALYRFADGVIDGPRKRLVCVREDHTDPSPAAVRNELVAVALDGSGAVSVLASGRDFYSAPRLSPDGATTPTMWPHPIIAEYYTEYHTIFHQNPNINSRGGEDCAAITHPSSTFLCARALLCLPPCRSVVVALASRLAAAA